MINIEEVLEEISKTTASLLRGEVTGKRVYSKSTVPLPSHCGKEAGLSYMII